jgi:uncharacterized protein YjbJ (UPF0337 family)
MNNDKAEGKAKEVTGKLTGDEDLESKGKAQGTAGDIKDKVEDVVEGAVDKVKGLLGK